MALRDDWTARAASRGVGAMLMVVFVVAEAGPAPAQTTDTGEAVTRQDVAAGFRMRADGAVDVPLTGGPAAVLPPELAAQIDALALTDDDAALVAGIEQLVVAQARGDPQLAAAIGRYAALRWPHREELIGLGVLRGNPRAAQVLLANLPNAGAPQAPPPAGSQSGLTAAALGRASGTDPAWSPTGSAAIGGDGVPETEVGAAAPSDSEDGAGARPDRGGVTRRPLISGAAGVAGVPNGRVASPSRP